MKFHLELLDKDGEHRCGTAHTIILDCKRYQRTHTYQNLVKLGVHFRVTTPKDQSRYYGEWVTLEERGAK